tara:strand:- start:655 stop:891 length:237 start_codon:yes stop_codon:yes gene_type:complete
VDSAAPTVDANRNPTTSRFAAAAAGFATSAAASFATSAAAGFATSAAAGFATSARRSFGHDCCHRFSPSTSSDKNACN